MARFLVSGLVNLETTARVRGFPIQYYPIDYPFFGVGMNASGVALNLTRALRTLGDEVLLCSMAGNDLPGRMVLETLREDGIATDHVALKLAGTPVSAVLYDDAGRRQIYCDLKDIQEASCDFSPDLLENVDAVIACNINFNRPLLRMAKEAGKLIATDVHVLSDPNDAYNRDFMEAADVLFLSDEGVEWDSHGFLYALAERFPCRILVMGRGAKGALMYLRESNRLVEQPACAIGGVVNTIGAGDALFSSFLHFLAGGAEAEKALRKAQLFAAMKIRHAGASRGFPTEEEMRKEEAGC